MTKHKNVELVPITPDRHNKSRSQQEDDHAKDKKHNASGGKKRKVKHKKTFVEPTHEDFLKHLQETVPGTLTGDKLTSASTYGWRGVSHVEMDRILAGGPTIDPVLHRGLSKFVEEFC